MAKRFRGLLYNRGVLITEKPFDIEADSIDEAAAKKIGAPVLRASHVASIALKIWDPATYPNVRFAHYERA